MISMFLYLTANKPSRKAAREFTTWLEDNYPECSFVEINLDKRSHPIQNAGRYQARVEGPETWSDVDHASHREAVFAAARSMLAN
jgi:hypothetical protein